METGNRPGTGRIAIEVQYNGTGYNGWQIQSGGKTVQGEIEKAAGILLKQKIRAIAAGRTDSGVHALGQVVHFDTTSGIALQRLCFGLNGILPRDIAIKNAYRVNGDFHARYGAVERSYRYLIYNNPLRTPFMVNRAMWVNERIDLDYLKTAAAYLVGEKDFSSFCKKRERKNKNMVRRVVSIDINRDEDFVTFDITGNAFLHNMVRIIIGTLVEMGRRKSDPGLIGEILSKRDREFSGITAPPYGLYLRKVVYRPGLETMESAF
jgi:tRNA pseudouridine38-40 synthase